MHEGVLRAVHAPQEGPHLRGKASFGHDDLADVYRWKYRGLWPEKQVASMRARLEEDVLALTERAFNCTDELEALMIVTVIPGAQAAGASAVLMAHAPERDTVMDGRAIRSLIWPLQLWDRERHGTAASFLGWLPYLEMCRQLAARATMPLRDVDRALWAAKGRF